MFKHAKPAAKLPSPQALPSKRQPEASVTQLLSALGEVVAPPRCMGCYREDVWLCSACRQQAPSSPRACISCQRPQASSRVCRQCRSSTTLAGVVSVGPYTSPLLRHGIHWLKFHGARDCAAALAYLLIDRLTMIAPLPTLRQRALLVPMPLHRRRERERGFNQSNDLARHLSLRSGIPVAHLLQRTRVTRTQTKLPLSLRAHNTADAFALTHEATKPFSAAVVRWLLVVDDVATTGATLSAAGAALQSVASSPTEIWGVTIARG